MLLEIFHHDFFIFKDEKYIKNIKRSFFESKHGIYHDGQESKILNYM
jgi:hypothetical protein